MVVRSARFWILGWVAGIWSCAPLPALVNGACGNGVVDRGEDCDTPDGSCHQPGAPQACRFACTADPDCPAGYHCGVDQVCRQASGDFELASEIPTEGVASITLADFDGNRSDDILTLEDVDGLKLYYNDSSAKVVSQLSLSSFSVPAVGQLTEEVPARADIVDVASSDVGVLRGQADRTLLPTAYSSIPVPDENSTYFILDAHPPDGSTRFAQQEVLRLSGTTVTTLELDQLFDVGWDAKDAVLPIPSGNIDARLTSPCEEFVLGRKGSDILTVYSPCLGIGWNPTHTATSTVQLLPGRSLAQAPKLLDVNGDAHLDLVIFAEFNGAPAAVQVAYGQGDGSFHSQPTPPVSPALPDGRTSKLTDYPAPQVHAVADLNDDGALDYVTAIGVAVSNLNGTGSCGSVSPGPGQQDSYDCIPEDASGAVVADFNANGILDVAVIKPDSRAVVFLNGAGGGLFNRYTIATQGYPLRILAGDFDGDLLSDIAISESETDISEGNGEPLPNGSPSTPDSARNDSLSLLFGRPFAAPEAPVSMGRLNRIVDMASGRLSVNGIDGISDIGVLSSESTSNGVTRTLALFSGDTNRKLQSPFLLVKSDQEIPDSAIRSWIAPFSGNDSHLDIAVLGLDNSDGASRLWYLPSSGEAALSQSTSSHSEPFPMEFDACSALGLALDLDQDGRSELVLIGQTYSGSGMLSIARPSDSGFSFDPPRDLPELYGRAGGSAYCNVSPAPAPLANVGGASEDIAEVNLGAARAVLASSVSYDPNDGLSNTLQVFPIGAGQLDVDAHHPLAISGPDAPYAVRAFSVVNLDTDPEPEILFITRGRVHLGEFSPDLAGVSVTRRVLALSDSLDSDGSTLPGSFLDTLIGKLATGDVNGDGLADFVLNWQGGLRVYTGKAKLP